MHWVAMVTLPMSAADGSSGQQRPSRDHYPEFSAQHPMVPRLYVMPWKQDMQHQRLVLKNARLAGIPVVHHEEALFLMGRERLCHGQDRAPLTPSSSSSSFPNTSSQSGEPAQLPSHLSRYNSSLITTRGLYCT